MKLNELILLDEATSSDVKQYVELFNDLGTFLSLNTAHITQDAKDEQSKSELKTMQQQFRKPIVNGMGVSELTSEWPQKTLINPKVIPIVLKWIYEMLRYIEPRIEKYLRDDRKKDRLDRLNQIKDKYRKVVGLFS